jgi:hypothetical protein
VRAFLQHPRLLLDLQETVLIEGVPYWQRLAREAPESARLDANGWRRLDRFLRVGNSASPRVQALSRWRSWHWLAILPTAGSLLVAVAVLQRQLEPTSPLQQPEAPTNLAGNWGWLRRGAFPQELSRADYLERLGREAEEWFNKRPDEPATLARRIAEFRQGCTALILGDHRPLSPQDRRWLVQTCRKWASDLDEDLAEVESLVNPLLIRDKVDDTTRQIARELRNRAAAHAWGHSLMGDRDNAVP